MSNSKITFTQPEFAWIIQAVVRLHAVMVKEVTFNQRAAKTSGAQTVAGLYSRFSNYVNVAHSDQTADTPIAASLSRHEIRLMARVCNETIERLTNSVIPNYKLRIEKDGTLKDKYQPYIENSQNSIDKIISPLVQKLEKAL